MKRRIDPVAGVAALQSYLAGSDSELKTAVRFCLEEFAQRHPGRAVELRVPPYGAVQALPGTVHRRGTPPAVVECSPETWIDLCVGKIIWEAAGESGAVAASGERTNLSEHLPLWQGGRII